MTEPSQIGWMRYTLKVTSLTPQTKKTNIELLEDLAGDDEIFHEEFARVTDW